jgi:hypothetical protein
LNLPGRRYRDSQTESPKAFLALFRASGPITADVKHTCGGIGVIHAARKEYFFSHIFIPGFAGILAGHLAVTNIPDKPFRLS